MNLINKIVNFFGKNAVNSKSVNDKDYKANMPFDFEKYYSVSLAIVRTPKPFDLNTMSETERKERAYRVSVESMTKPFDFEKYPSPSLFPLSGKSKYK